MLRTIKKGNDDWKHVDWKILKYGCQFFLLQEVHDGDDGYHVNPTRLKQIPLAYSIRCTKDSA